MKKHRSISFMVWPIILGLVGVAVTVSTIPDMTPEQLEAELNAAQQEKQQMDQEAHTLALALFEESYRRARVEVKP